MGRNRQLEDRVQKSEPYVLSKRKNYGVSVRWECLTGKAVDLDLQAVIVDERGLVVDAVYYNNLVAMNGAIGHTGDAVKQSFGLEESVWVRFAKLPNEVKLIIFVLAATSGCRLRDADNGKVSLCETMVTNKVREAEVEKSAADADVIAMMKRLEDGSWAYYEVEEPAEKGSHFLDILEPSIGDLIRKEIPCAPRVQKVAFVMDKGAVADFPETATLRRLSVGIGGELKPGVKKSIDIDISAHFYSHDGKNMGQVDADNDGMHGVRHSGDSVAGASVGDDEAITIDLTQMPPNVGMMFFLLTVRNGTFEKVKRPYARVIDQTATELVRFDVQGGQNMNGLVIGRLFRSPGKRWAFQAIGKYFHNAGRSWASARQELSTIINPPKDTSASSKALVRSGSLQLPSVGDSQGGQASGRRSLVMSVPIGGTATMSPACATAGSMAEAGSMEFQSMFGGANGAEDPDDDDLGGFSTFFRRRSTAELSGADKAAGLGSLSPSLYGSVRNRKSVRASTVMARGLLRLSAVDDEDEVEDRAETGLLDTTADSTVRPFGEEAEEDGGPKRGACGSRCGVAHVPFVGACMAVQL